MCRLRVPHDLRLVLNFPGAQDVRDIPNEGGEHESQDFGSPQEDDRGDDLEGSGAGDAGELPAFFRAIAAGHRRTCLPTRLVPE